MIVLQLAEEGRLGLDDALEQYVPRVVPGGSRITISQLLNHTSGLADYTDFPEWLERADRSRSLRPIDVLEFAAAKPRVFGRPGGSWSYSNTNYTALGLVIETVTGHTLRQELARRIVRPLGLGRTELAATRRLPDLDDAGVNPNVPWAAGGIVSSPGDLARFFAALLSGRLVSEASLKEMQQDGSGPRRIDSLRAGARADRPLMRDVLGERRARARLQLVRRGERRRPACRGRDAAWKVRS